MFTITLPTQADLHWRVRLAAAYLDGATRDWWHADRDMPVRIEDLTPTEATGWIDKQIYGPEGYEDPYSPRWHFQRWASRNTSLTIDTQSRDGVRIGDALHVRATGGASPNRVLTNPQAAEVGRFIVAAWAAQLKARRRSRPW